MKDNFYISSIITTVLLLNSVLHCQSQLIQEYSMKQKQNETKNRQHEIIQLIYMTIHRGKFYPFFMSIYDNPNLHISTSLDKRKKKKKNYFSLLKLPD